VTVLTRRMREELVRRNYAETTIRTYLMAMEEFRRHAEKRLDYLGPEDIRHISSYETPASSHNFARRSLALIPIARTAVSARLSLLPRSMPKVASRDAIRSVPEWSATSGARNLGIAFSIRSIRDLSFVCIWQPVVALSLLHRVFHVTRSPSQPLRILHRGPQV